MNRRTTPAPVHAHRLDDTGVRTARPRPRQLLGLISLALLAAPVSAQSATSGALDLTAYRSLATALDQSVQDRVKGSAPSLGDLDRATAAYTTLKPGLSSSLLTGGIDTALQSARAALDRAPADLEAQVVQARSLMRKALYDQTLGELGRTTVAPAVSAQAGVLASEFGLQGSARTRFLGSVSAHDGATAARLLRSAAAQKVQTNLSAARVPQNAAQRTATYLALARATGWFTVVQDAPDTGGLKLSGFTQALTQLTGNDNTTLATSLTTLKQGAAAFVSASARSAAGGSAPQTPATQTPAAQTPATRTPASQTPATQAPATQTPATQIPATQVPVTQTPAERQQASLNAAYAALARAQAAAGHAALDDARNELGRASGSLASSGLSGAAGYDALLSDLSALQTRSGLRPGDVQAVTGELNNLERRAGNLSTSVLDTTSAAVSRLGTPLWPLLFLIVGLLAIYPLYLLNLAFGGRNNYWKAIAASLLLLFVPVMLEGLGGTFAYLGDLSGAPFLRALGNLSLHQGVWAQPIWLLLAAGAVGLASYGFRGLCRQFGLLGGSSGMSANPTRIETAQASLDWDEEL